MIAPASRPRPRPRSLRSGAFFVLTACATLLLAPLAGDSALLAQEPDTLPREPRDTLPLDPDPRERVGPDTAAQDTAAQDTVPEPRPPDVLPVLDPLGPASVARGAWEWDRPALQRLPALSLLDLLERIPGVVPVRSDLVNHPETGVVFGATAGAIRYVMDGFELDPLAGPTFDPSRVPLLALERVRVERRVTGATVHIESLSPEEAQPRTIIEAGTGDFNVQLFRGMFLGPEVLGGSLGAGFERLASNGSGSGASNHTAGWLKWSWVRDSVGLQVEYRQGDMDRLEPDDELFGFRRDWLVRGRAARGPLVGEVYAGASQVEDQRQQVVIHEGSPHAGARLRADVTAPVPAEALTALRLRDHPRLPRAELELGLRTMPRPWLAIEAEAVRGWWTDGAGTGRWAARAQAGPALGVTAFSEVFRGEPLAGGGTGVRVAAPDSADLRVVRHGVRAGAVLALGGAEVSAAAVRTRADTVPALGFPAEITAPRLPGGRAMGFEAMARIPTGWEPLSLQGWYVGMDAPADWLYLPDHHWRAGIVYHHLPLPSGNLEIFARVEHVFRGRMAVPRAEPVDPADPAEPADPEASAPGDVPPAEVLSIRSSNLELSIRVLTVRAFLRWENFMNRRDQQDLPLFTHPGQHVLYGVKWEFSN